MFVEYKKPGGWLWTPCDGHSLEEDMASGAIPRESRFRLDGREMDVDELLQITADERAQRDYRRSLAAYQKEPLPPPPEFPAATAPLAVLLTRYISRYVGINYRGTKKFERALLTRVSDDFLTIFAEEKQTNITFPLRHVLSIVEAEKGVSTGVIFRDEFCVVIEVFHVVVYSGAVGVSIPL